MSSETKHRLIIVTVCGNAVVRGDRILEVVAGEATIDLPAPVSGRLVEQCVVEDDVIEVGQILGRIEDSED